MNEEKEEKQNEKVNNHPATSIQMSVTEKH